MSSALLDRRGTESLRSSSQRGGAFLSKPQSVLSRTSSCESHASNRNYNTKNGSSSSTTTTKILEERRKRLSGDGYSVHTYTMGRLLGKGGFAKVYLCTANDSGKQYAVKVVPKANLVKARARQKVRAGPEGDEREDTGSIVGKLTRTTHSFLFQYFQLQAEIKIHRELKHRYVCQYKHYFEDKENCYILLELCHNQSLNEMIKRRKRITEPEAAYFMQQLVEATRYLHSENVIHRDLKLGNLFLDKDMWLKVGDLGLATRVEDKDEKRKTICGTPNYIAPEIIQGDRSKRGHSFPVDIWSMGVILYTVLVGKPPYEAKDVKATYQRILHNEYSFPRHVEISASAKNLIQSMLQSNPKDRPSLDDIDAHPFFRAVPKSLPSSVLSIAPTWRVDGYGHLSLASRKPLTELGQQSQKPPKRGGPVSLERVKTAIASMTISTAPPRPPAIPIFSDAREGPPATRNTAAMSDGDVLQLMVDHMDQVLYSPRGGGSTASGTAAVLPAKQGPAKWVTRYVDYTSKYGVGFLLSDGTSGVYFNDSTKTSLEANGSTFQYIERKKDDKQRRGETTIQTHSLEDYPAALKKKVTLLKHFRNYLVQQHMNDGDDCIFPSSSQGDFDYVKKWVRTKHAILFLLSNRTVQAIFFDQTELLLTPDGKTVTVVDAQGERSTYAWSSVPHLFASSNEHQQRLQYTKDILIQLLTGGSSTK